MVSHYFRLAYPICAYDTIPPFLGEASRAAAPPAERGDDDAVTAGRRHGRAWSMSWAMNGRATRDDISRCARRRDDFSRSVNAAASREDDRYHYEPLYLTLRSVRVGASNSFAPNTCTRRGYHQIFHSSSE